VLFTFLRQLSFFNYSIKERLSQSVVNTFTKLLKTKIRICDLPPAMVCADTIWIIKWLNPKSNPHIILGNKDELLSGPDR